MNSHRPCRLFRPFNSRTLRLYLTVLAAGLTLLGAGAIINLASLKLTNTGIEVRGDNNQISFEVPRSPGEVTAATIACDGTVEVVRRSPRPSAIAPRKPLATTPALPFIVWF